MNTRERNVYKAARLRPRLHPRTELVFTDSTPYAKFPVYGDEDKNHFLPQMGRRGKR